MSRDLAFWTPRSAPGREPIEGRFVRVEPMRDGWRFDELYDSYTADPDESTWRFLAYGPFHDRDSFRRFARETYLKADPLFHAVVPLASRRAEGVAALMRLDPANGVAEIGHIALAPALRGTPATTEMQYLLMRRVFDELGYRRYEWKCDSGNEPSKRAAARLGFQYEGLFRQHMVVKGRNRDTAWFAILDGDWPALKRAFEAWLAPENFDADGRQRRALESFRAAV